MQLCILACLRFTAIVYPFKLKTHCTCKVVILMSMAGWVAILIVSGIYGFFIHTVVYTIFCAVVMAREGVNFLIPSSVFIVLHCLKLRALRRSPSLSNNSSWGMNVIMIIVLSIYSISSASLLIYSFMACYFNYKNNYVFITVKISFLINCAANPFIYFFLITTNCTAAPKNVESPLLRMSRNRKSGNAERRNE